MAKTITIAGNTYPDVPYIVVPAAEGGTVAFRHCTGTKDIYDNGLMSVAGYENVYVNVESGGGGIPEIDLAWMLQSGEIPEEIAEALADNESVCVTNATTFGVIFNNTTHEIEWGNKVIMYMPDDGTINIATQEGNYVYMAFPSEWEEISDTTYFTETYATNFGYDANTEDATATESDILLGKTAYVNGAKLEGTYEADVPFAWGGMNAVKVAEYSETFTLADTSFVIGSSASTSATNIKAAVSGRFNSGAIVVNDKDIVVVQSCKVKPTHSASATAKARMVAHAGAHVTYVSKRKTTDTSAKTTRHPAPYTATLIKYYNTSGTLTRAGANYGFYATMQQASASATAASPTVQVASPALYYRASSSYESTANIKLVTECTWEWTVEVYLVDPFSTVGAAANDLIDSLITG